jgi:hypothetical protein
MSSELKFHPLADIFPLMEGEEFAALVADIKANGLHEKITLYEDKILEGRNRYRALQQLGRTVGNFTRAFRGTEEEAQRYVISKNIHRRHLSPEQKRELIAKLLKAQPEKSNNAISKQAKVDDKTVAKVRCEMERRSEIPNVSTRTDTKGRKQPAKKADGARPRGRKPPRSEKSKREIIIERNALVRRLIAADRELVVLLSKFFGKYPDQIKDFFVDVSHCATNIEEDEQEERDRKECVALECVTEAEKELEVFKHEHPEAKIDDGLDIPESLRRAPVGGGKP